MISLRRKAAILARRKMSAIPRRSRTAIAGDDLAQERLQKVLRNYAMEYITSIVPETVAVLGPETGAILQALRRASSECIRLMRSQSCSAASRRADRICDGFRETGKRSGRRCRAGASRECRTIRQTTWRLMAERHALSPAVFDAWNELWVGAALAHDRFMRIEVTERRDRGDPGWRWTFS